MVLARNVIAKTLLLAVLTGYTIFSAGPFGWVAIMSLRTTPEIIDDPYALPTTMHFQKFADVWFGANYETYFWNSILVTVISVAILSIVGAMAAHCLARYRFPGNRFVYFLLFSAIILPPQITIIGLFQLLVNSGLYNSLTGIILVYVAMQLPLTIYILEGFFRRIPQDLFDAARIDGYSDFQIFWRITIPIGISALSTTIILNMIYIWNEFLYAVVFLVDDDKRTLPLGIQRFMGDHLDDTGMLATGLMIAIVPVIVAYAFFSEKVIQGMTVGAVK